MVSSESSEAVRTRPEGKPLTRRRPETPLPSARYRSLDTWRGLACLMVVVFHATYGAVGVQTGPTGVWGVVVSVIRRLWLGVPIFFVISGYCIAASCAPVRLRNGSVAGYFVRRFRRIYPPYWAALGLTAALVWSWPGAFSAEPHPFTRPESLGAVQWLGNLTLTENWRWQLGGEGRSLLAAQAWTLCYEEQFYAVCGLILVAAPRYFFVSVTAVSACVVAWLAVWAAGLTGVRGAGFFFDGLWLQFAAGVWVYQVAVYGRRPAGLRWAAIWGATAFSAVAVSYALPLDRMEVLSYAAAAATAAALVALRPFDEQIFRHPLARPLNACGRICYSLYLVHAPVIKAVSHGLHAAGVRGFGATLAVTAPAAVAASVVVAWAFYHVFEKRVLNPTRVIP